MAARPFISDRHGSRSVAVRRRAAFGAWGGACVGMPLCRCVVADAAGRVSWVCAPGRRSFVMQRRWGAALQCSGRHPPPQGVGSNDRRAFVPLGCLHVRTAKPCPATRRSAVRTAKGGCRPRCARRFRQVKSLCRRGGCPRGWPMFLCRALCGGGSGRGREGVSGGGAATVSAARFGVFEHRRRVSV
jgi:hypothetical protein